MKQLLPCALLILTLSACNGCKNDNPSPAALPPVTDSGRNTFGCIIDNRVFLPQVPLLSSMRSRYWTFSRYGNGRGRLVVGAQNDKTDVDLSLQLDSIDLQSNSLYVIGRGKNSVATVSKDGSSYSTRDADAQGVLLVRRYDSTAGVLSGTFWFDAVNATSGTHVQVTEGRFDLPPR